ncbi:hypothetical protein DVR12_19695 [Chitinophaga silvatica]|uniref:Uncharacterized protein n=1 Tax=Chitinophaga silvatica TaxID=2282649 RepID=A0A3E1Y5F0_9BACT|nr:hypothetical protein [Chitinophaga silvatica]RFS19956.1 hypothetical protein DVR12_19695 [Chitinophaga silvatica]
MGLDLYHCIPCVKEEDVTIFESFTLDELSDCPEFIDQHKNLITEIVEPEDYFTISIFSKSSDLEHYLDRYKKEENTIYLIGNFDNLVDEISKHETANNLRRDERFILTTTSKIGNPDIISTNINYPVGAIKKKVIYFKEIGYQRKGMEIRFYEDFTNCQPYFKKADVLKAATYVSRNNKERSELNEHFKTAFIDNFIEGTSIFFGSW